MLLKMCSYLLREVFSVTLLHILNVFHLVLLYCNLIQRKGERKRKRGGGAREKRGRCGGGGEDTVKDWGLGPQNYQV